MVGVWVPGPWTQNKHKPLLAELQGSSANSQRAVGLALPHGQRETKGTRSPRLVLTCSAEVCLTGSTVLPGREHPEREHPEREHPGREHPGREIPGRELPLPEVQGEADHTPREDQRGSPRTLVNGGPGTSPFLLRGLVFSVQRGGRALTAPVGGLGFQTFVAQSPCVI